MVTSISQSEAEYSKSYQEKQSHNLIELAVQLQYFPINYLLIWLSDFV